MTTEAEVKALRQDLGNLAAAVEQLAEAVEDIARGRPKTSTASIASNARTAARTIALRNR
jgi:hypothetical protein